MIRYALVLALAATTLGITAAAVDQTGTVRGERAVKAEIQTVDGAATSLYADGTITVGEGPRRLITVEIHEQQPTEAKPEQIRFERIEGTATTRVTYRVQGGQRHERKIDVPIRQAGGGPVELTDWRGTQRLVLRLVRDDSGEPVVTVEPYN
jgi:hypothetical protein